MIYIDEEGKTRCTECCISCGENTRTCEARIERRRYWNRMKYKAKKEYEGKKAKS